MKLICGINIFRYCIKYGKIKYYLRRITYPIQNDFNPTDDSKSWND